MAWRECGGGAVRETRVARRAELTADKASHLSGRPDPRPADRRDPGGGGGPAARCKAFGPREGGWSHFIKGLYGPHIFELSPPALVEAAWPHSVDVVFLTAPPAPQRGKRAKDATPEVGDQATSSLGVCLVLPESRTARTKQLTSSNIDKKPF